MTNLLHELRCFTGGELGNRAADEIERQAREIATLNSAGLFVMQKATDLHVQLQSSLTIETVSAWLDTQGLCAVSKADAERVDAILDEMAASALKRLARRALWIAYVWNDHNHAPAHKIAKDEAEACCINSFDDANEFIGRISGALLEHKQ